MEQGSNNWLEWRKQGIGSSDAPAILGLSKWMTRYQLWELKTGRAPEQVTNWAMERGNRLEPKARAHYELLCDLDMKPTLVIHPEHSFLRASLDGYNAEAGRILEIKCPGKEDHQTAMEGQVPEVYMAQLQHQLLVTGAKQVDYFSFDGEKGVIVPVTPDSEFQEKLMKEEFAFWELIQKDTPPELGPRDFKTIKDPTFEALCGRYRLLYSQLATIEEAFQAVKKQIATAANGARIRCNGVQVMPITRKGSIDYSKIPVLKGLDLEPYRKKASTYLDVRIKEAVE